MLQRSGRGVPGRINEQDIQALRERADLAVVVGAHTALTRNGTRLKGLCPFHGEKTPSFTVDPARGLFHCFGCGAGGDVYGFLQRAEALSFPEAVERLARIVGYDLHYEELSPGQRKALGRRTRIGEAVAAAAAFYADLLGAEEGRAALAYLRGRGVSDAEVGAFGLGWAPDSWDALTRHLLGSGFDVAELLDAGLVSQGRQGPVDRFRGRVMFPIRDATGRDVVAFGGRLVPGVELRTDRDGNAPKYLNSPETELYHKSRILYGLDQARAEVARRQVALVVEGYMDVIALARAGVRYAVATCGTALTAEHFALLERHTPRVVLALDADEAGFAAAEKARELAEQVGVREVAVLQLPAGQDPADVAGGGAQAVEQALSRVVTAVEFQIAHLLRTADVSTPEGQVAAYRRTFPLLEGIADRFLRYRYVRDVVAPRVRLNADLIERELDAALPVQPGEPVRAEPVQGSPAPGDIGSGAQRDPQMVLERTLLQIALQRPELLPEVWEQVSEDEFRAPASRRLFARLRSCRPGDLEAVLAGLPDDDARGRVRSLAMDELTVPTRAWAEELLARFRSAAVQRELDDVRAELAQVNASTDAARSRELTRRRVDLELRRRALLDGRTA
jgi:DNA primase